MNRIVKNSLVVFSLLAVMFSCKEEVAKEKSIRSVKVEKLSSSQQIKSHISLPATVNELSDTKLSFRVGGPLVKLNDVVGSYIKRGEVIARLDQRDFEIGIEATESAFKLAEAEYERYKNLLSKKSVSKSAFDQVETQYKINRTNYESALNALKDTEIKAPFSGYINHTFVNNFEAIAPGQPIVSLLDMSKFEINGWISVADAPRVDENSIYTCIVNQGGKEYRIPGELKEIGTKTTVTKQSLPITILIDSPEDIKLRAGITTYLEISSNDAKVTSSIQVPLSSLFTRENLTYVWIFNEKTNSVSAKEVSTGKILESGKMSITRGLQGDENIVIAGVNYLYEGQKVDRLKGYSESNVGDKL